LLLMPCAEVKPFTGSSISSKKPPL
jgi:hypothetical protein